MTVADLIKALQAVPHTSAEVRLGVANLVTAAGDFTGGSAEDLFTATAHGLSNGDRLQLIYESAAGVVTGNVGTVFVLADRADNTFRLNTEAGVLVENTADGTAVFAVISDAGVSTAGATSTGIQADGPGVDAIDPGYVAIG